MADAIETPMEDLTERVIHCAIAVHNALGPGLLESIYRDCLAIELRATGLKVEIERHIAVVYRGYRVRDDLKLDLLVSGRLLIEIKAVDRIHPVHLAQVITYLKLSGCESALVLNFNVTSIRQGIRRLDHPDVYARKRQKRLGRLQSSSAE